jgi:glutamine synthetase
MTSSRANSDLNVARIEKELSEKGIKFCLSSFVDMHGKLKSKIVPLDHLESMVAGSERFTGAALDGVPQDVSDEEVATHPDIDSCAILPWNREVAWFASDLWLQGQPFEACSRNILNRIRQQGSEAGYVFNLGVEAEFFVLRDGDNGPAPVSDRDSLRLACYDTIGALDNLHWLSELVEAMQGLGWGVYSFDHEDANGQFEIDFGYAEGRTMADRYVFFRLMANEIARKHGYFATFMPKPFVDKTGSGAHFNMSLADQRTGKNLFAETNDPRRCGLSEVGYHFVGGLLRHLPAIMAVVAPSVNSYKRLVKRGYMSQFTWAPVFASYGNNNRTNALRIPQGGGRIELRAADSSCNPYLGAAMVLAAGLEGIKNRIDPGPPMRENLYLKTDDELARLGLSMLPRTLGEALDGFRADPLSKQVFGEKMYYAWLAYKDDEWLGFLNHVTDWERARYLRFF